MRFGSPSQPEGRVREHGLEGELRCANERGLGPEKTRHDPDQATRRAQRPPIELGVDDRGDMRINSLE
jgi:hypothetical protein